MSSPPPIRRAATSRSSHLTPAERKALLVAGATAGMTAVFGTPVAAVLLAVELLLFELRPRSLLKRERLRGLPWQA